MAAYDYSGPKIYGFTMTVDDSGAKYDLMVTTIAMGAKGTNYYDAAYFSVTTEDIVGSLNETMNAHLDLLQEAGNAVQPVVPVS